MNGFTTYRLSPFWKVPLGADKSMRMEDAFLVNFTFDYIGSND